MAKNEEPITVGIIYYNKIKKANAMKMNMEILEKIKKDRPIVKKDIKNKRLSKSNKKNKVPKIPRKHKLTN